MADGFSERSGVSVSKRLLIVIWATLKYVMQWYSQGCVTIAAISKTLSSPQTETLYPLSSNSHIPFTPSLVTFILLYLLIAFFFRYFL